MLKNKNVFVFKWGTRLPRFELCEENPQDCYSDQPEIDEQDSIGVYELD